MLLQSASEIVPMQCDRIKPFLILSKEHGMLGRLSWQWSQSTKGNIKIKKKKFNYPSKEAGKHKFVDNLMKSWPFPVTLSAAQEKNKRCVS